MSTEGMAAATDERRRFGRIVFDPPREALVNGSPATLLNVGRGGAAIEHEEQIIADSRVTVSFEWHGPIVVEARAVRVTGDEGRFESALLIDETPPALDRSVAIQEAIDEIARLRTLVEASKLINSSIEPDTLFESILTVARRELGVERGTLYFVDQHRGEIWAKIAAGLESAEIRLPIGRGLAGYVAETGEPVILHDAYADPRFDRSQDLRSGYVTRSMLCAPIRNRDQKIVGVLQLLNKTLGSFGDGDLEFLDSISDHMAIAMENATLHLDLIEKNRMEKELQLGREIQARLLPEPPTGVRGIEIVAASHACYEVGGDYFDFLELPSGELGIAIGDVSGKGVAAAMIMSSIQSALRIAAPLETDLAALMTRLNALLHRATSGRKYATFFFGRYDPRSGELRYVSAGHNPPFLHHDGSIDQLPSTGLPIGLMPQAAYTTASVTLGPGATLFLYTDGFNEAANPEEEELGMPRWEALVREHATMSLDGMLDRIFESITGFEDGAAPTDDKTIVVVRRAADKENPAC